MKTIDLGDITLVVDTTSTEKFYATQSGFVCDCPDCTNYVSKIPDVLKSLNGIEKQLGIDLFKDVGQGMDELFPHDFDDHHLYVVPYYVIGWCYVNGKKMEKLFERERKEIAQNLSLEIVNTPDISLEIGKPPNNTRFENDQNIFTLWIEFKTELINK